MYSKKFVLFFLVSITTINTTFALINIVDYGAAEQENWRGARGYKFHRMEDCNTMLPGKGYFAVFDGHGRAEAAKYAAEHLHEILQSLKETETCSTEKLFELAFIKADNEIMEETGSGTTAVVALVDSEEGMLHIANVGDSRALVMCTENSTKQLSIDHKAESERERIEAVGGAIYGGRTGGTVAVSRALGDKCVKWTLDKKEKEKTEENYLVSPIPHTKSISLENVKFLVLVSDGITDVMDNQEIMYFVNKLLDAKMSAQTAAESLVEKAAELESSDDLTVIVVVFQNASTSSSSSSSSPSPKPYSAFSPPGEPKFPRKNQSRTEKAKDKAAGFLWGTYNPPKPPKV